MSKWVDLALLALLAGPASAGSLGRPALPEEIAAWDRTVLPDGTGLPVGSGTVEQGDAVFAEKCAACHGDFAEGIDNWPVLAGGTGTLKDARPVKTIGSYWPHLSTVFDYIHRSMPFGAAQTVSADETYAIVAFLLYSNGIVEDDFTLSNANFTSVRLPNEAGFRADDRATVEYPRFRQPACLSDCGPAVTVTKRAVKLNVTPMEDGLPAGTLPDPSPGPSPVPDRKAEAEGTVQVAATAPTGPDPALVQAGEKVFAKCKACHKLDGSDGVGPHLDGVVGRGIGAVDGFQYSPALTAYGAGRPWDEALLAAFLANPRSEVEGTRMAFAGLKKPGDIAAVIAYLSTSRAP